jgi:hypothetical protein
MTEKRRHHRQAEEEEKKSKNRLMWRATVIHRLLSIVLKIVNCLMVSNCLM